MFRCSLNIIQEKKKKKTKPYPTLIAGQPPTLDMYLKGVRPEKFQFLEKKQNSNFGQKIRNLFSRSQMTKRISPLESSREI